MKRQVMKALLMTSTGMLLAVPLALTGAYGAFNEKGIATPYYVSGAITDRVDNLKLPGASGIIANPSSGLADTSGIINPKTLIEYVSGAVISGGGGGDLNYMADCPRISFTSAVAYASDLQCGILEPNRDSYGRLVSFTVDLTLGKVKYTQDIILTNDMPPPLSNHANCNALYVGDTDFESNNNVYNIIHIGSMVAGGDLIIYSNGYPLIAGSLIRINCTYWADNRIFWY